MAKKKKDVVVEPKVDLDENLNGTDTSPENTEEVKVETLVGKVIGCTALNIRTGPSIANDIVGRVNAGAEVNIDNDESTSEWYKVTTSGNITGFCIRKYIAIIG